MSNQTASLSSADGVITFPLTTDYCGTWSLTKAIVEVVSNAFDESDAVSLKWKDGYMEIEDQGQGLPRKGLLIGFSSKRQDGKKIGQFGEGLNIAMLVAARTHTEMLVETVGYSVVPKAVFDTSLDAEVLQVAFGPSSRQQGTLVQIKTTDKQAEAVKSRFLRFQKGYTIPSSPGRVVKNYKGGSIFVGGVLVKEGTKNKLSYDLCLEDVKKGLNRDRTFLDDWMLDAQIGKIIAHIKDPQLMADILQAAIENKVTEREIGFDTHTPTTKRFLAELVRPLLFGDKLVAVASWNTDTNSNAEYQGYTLLAKDGRHVYQLRRIFAAMGIPESTSVAAQELTKKEKQRVERVKLVEWATKSDLTPSRQKNLDEAMAAVTNLLGKDAFGAVRVFRSTVKEQLCAASGRWGFYQPRDGSIAINLEPLDSFSNTLSVLVHEVGHRLAHHDPHYRYDYGDRAHGFEHALEGIAARALSRLIAIDKQSHRIASNNPVATPEEANIEASVFTGLPVATRIQNETSILLTQRLKALGETTASLGKKAYVPSGSVRNIIAGRRVLREEYVEAVCQQLRVDYNLVMALTNIDRFHYWTLEEWDDQSHRNKTGHIRLYDQARRQEGKSLDALLLSHPQLNAAITVLLDFIEKPTPNANTILPPAYNALLAELRKELANAQVPELLHRPRGQTSLTASQ